MTRMIYGYAKMVNPKIKLSKSEIAKRKSCLCQEVVSIVTAGSSDEIWFLMLRCAEMGYERGLRDGQEYDLCQE